jgi:predicted patatin/cPLA2 family phospholipase
MKALVISGGGSKGAFAGGVAQYLIEDCRKDYRLFLGTSSGSLLLPHLSIGKVAEIKEVFTTATPAKIFSSSPFSITKDSSGMLRTRVNHAGIVRMFMRGKKTLGESENLRKMIRENFSWRDFMAMKQSGKNVVVSVANLTTHEVEYKSCNHYAYNDFCDWVWISANLVPFMSLAVKNGFEYADGGFGNFIPIRKAIELGATEIDAISLRTSQTHASHLASKNVLDLFLKTFTFMINQIARDDIDLGRMEGLQNKVRINFYYIPSELTDNPLVFDPSQMTKWWDQGYRYAASEKPVIFGSKTWYDSLFG